MNRKCLLLCIGLSFAIHQLAVAALDPWHLRNPPVTSENLSAVTYGDGQFVAVGSAGTVLVSSNTIDWMRLNVGNSNDLLGITFTDGLFVALGKDARFNAVIFTSRDARQWTLQSNAISRGLVDATFGNGRFVAIGSSGWDPGITTVAHSLDATNWDGMILPMGDGYGNDVLFWRSNFWAASGGGVFSSSDGIAWTLKRTMGSLTGLAASETTLVAVDLSGTWSSTDEAISWTRHNLAPAYFYGVTFGNGLFVAVGGNGSLATSSDGAAWTLQPRVTSSLLEDVTYANGRWVAVGLKGTILVSSNGTEWTNITGVNVQLKGICFGQSNFVAVGAGAILSSPDGINWSNQPAGNLNAVTYATNIFVSVGSVILTSTNGLLWEQQAVVPPFPSTFTSIAYGRGTFVAVGGTDALNYYDSIVLTSVDGRNWQRQTIPNLGQLRSVAFGGGLFVAETFFSGSLISSNGTNWSRAGGFGGANGITYGQNRFISVSGQGEINDVFSGNTTTNVGAPLFGVTFEAGQFVAVGGGWDGSRQRPSKIFTSSNGIYWVESMYPGTVALNAVTYGRGRFMIAGDAGTILQSDLQAPLVTASYASSSMILRWQSVAGYSYGLIESEDFSVWNPVPDFAATGTGETLSFSLPVKTRHRFFRIRMTAE